MALDGGAMLLLARGAVSADGRGMTVHAWDADSGTTARMYKGPAVARHALWAGSRGMCAAQQDKGAIVFWGWQQETPMMKMPLPERATAVICSQKYDLCITGTASGAIYVWQMCTGSLVQHLSHAHFRAITGLALTGDELSLISISDDAAARVWSLAHLVFGFSQQLSGEVRPRHVFSHHTLPVTDLAVSAGPSSTARLVTVSRDRHVNLYHLGLGQRLACITFADDLTSVALDPAEQYLYVASSTGRVYQVSLHDEVLEQASGLISQSQCARRVQAHERPITCVAVVSNGARLVTTDDAGCVRLWDTGSMQVVKTLEEGTSLAALLVSPSQWLEPAVANPALQLKLFQRTRQEDQESDDRLRVVIAPTQEPTSTPVLNTTVLEAARQPEGALHAAAPKKGTETGHRNAPATSSTSDEPSAVEEDLRRELARWKARAQQLHTLAQQNLKEALDELPPFLARPEPSDESELTPEVAGNGPEGASGQPSSKRSKKKKKSRARQGSAS